jgi:hypothetical protein
MTSHTSCRVLLTGATILTALRIAALGGVPVSDVVGEAVRLNPRSPIMRLYHRSEAILAQQETAYEAVKGQGLEAEDAAYEAFAPERLQIGVVTKVEHLTDLLDLPAKVAMLSG